MKCFKRKNLKELTCLADETILKSLDYQIFVNVLHNYYGKYVRRFFLLLENINCDQIKCGRNGEMLSLLLLCTFFPIFKNHYFYPNRLRLHHQ